MNRPGGHRLRAGGVLRDHRLQHRERQARCSVHLELSRIERQLAGALPDGMRQRLPEIVG